MTKPQICNEIYKEISKKKENNKGCKNFKDNLKIINVEPLWQLWYANIPSLNRNQIVCMDQMNYF